MFALYISGVGNDITISNLGFQIGSVCISGLLFADDLVLVARSAEGLRSLLSLVKSKFDALRLTINAKKSEIISAEEGSWDLLGSDLKVEMTLKQVAQYTAVDYPLLPFVRKKSHSAFVAELNLLKQ